MEAWERIEFIIEREGMNKNSFSNAIGISNNVTITRIINEHRTPSRATCEKIVSAFPSYNLQWVLTGVFMSFIRIYPFHSLFMYS